LWIVWGSRKSAAEFIAFLGLLQEFFGVKFVQTPDSLPSTQPSDSRASQNVWNVWGYQKGTTGLISFLGLLHEFFGVKFCEIF
jgi:hypothetical protein